MAAHGVRLHAYEMARRASLKQAIRFVNVRAFAQARKCVSFSAQVSNLDRDSRALGKFEQT